MAELQLTLPSFRYPGAEQDALASINLSFEHGGFHALVGPSGTGKSTLLHLLARLRTAQGSTISGLAPHTRQALMFQNPRLMPWLNVRDNLALVGDGSPQHRLKCQELLERTGLQDRTQDFPGALSGGMQRRVALARAFSVAPQLLLMDEPFVSLDEPTAEKLRELLVELYLAERPTVIFVTHNLDEALQLADRVIFLSASPAQVILQHPLPQTRPRCKNTVQQIRDTLLQQHPHILRGESSP